MTEPHPCKGPGCSRLIRFRHINFCSGACAAAASVRKCEHCGSSYSARHAKSRYCSLMCSGRARTGQPHVICTHGLALDECRECVTVDVSVSQWVSVHPDGATYDEIAASLGMTWERVRQIIDGALDRLRAENPEYVSVLSAFEHHTHSMWDRADSVGDEDAPQSSVVSPSDAVATRAHDARAEERIDDAAE